jgi:hypothetical protein
MIAIELGNYDCAKTLMSMCPSEQILRKSAKSHLNYDKVDNKIGLSILMRAALKGDNCELLKLLVEGKANVLYAYKDKIL